MNDRDELVRKVAERTQGTAGDPLTEADVRKVLDAYDRIVGSNDEPPVPPAHAEPPDG